MTLAPIIPSTESEKKNPDTGQQVMTKTELLGGGETTVSVNSVHAGPDLMQKQHESALP